MTESSIEALYPQIGQFLADAIPEAWTSMQVIVKIKPGYISLQGKFMPETGEGLRSIRPNRQMAELFSQLHDRMVKELEENWSTAIFSMDCSGKFDIKFEYEVEE